MNACLLQSLKFPRVGESAGSRACGAGARRSTTATPANGPPTVSCGAWTMIGRVLLCFATLSVAVAAGEGGRTAEPPDGDEQGEARDLWRVENRCGINSLYVFMRLSGKPISYDEVFG